jgi:hypothetical protein
MVKADTPHLLAHPAGLVCPELMHSYLPRAVRNNDGLPVVAPTPAMPASAHPVRLIVRAKARRRTGRLGIEEDANSRQASMLSHSIEHTWQLARRKIVDVCKSKQFGACRPRLRETYGVQHWWLAWLLIDVRSACCRFLVDGAAVLTPHATNLAQRLARAMQLRKNGVCSEAHSLPHRTCLAQEE